MNASIINVTVGDNEYNDDKNSIVSDTYIYVATGGVILSATLIITGIAIAIRKRTRMILDHQISSSICTIPSSLVIREVFSSTVSGHNNDMVTKQQIRNILNTDIDDTTNNDNEDITIESFSNIDAVSPTGSVENDFLVHTAVPSIRNNESTVPNNTLSPLDGTAADKSGSNSNSRSSNDCKDVNDVNVSDCGCPSSDSIGRNNEQSIITVSIPSDIPMVISSSTASYRVFAPDSQYDLSFPTPTTSLNKFDHRSYSTSVRSPSITTGETTGIEKSTLERISKDIIRVGYRPQFVNYNPYKTFRKKNP